MVLLARRSRGAAASAPAFRLLAASLWIAVATLSCVDAIGLQELPRNPAVDCAGGAVLKAMLPCRAGPSDACCRGLDAVYSNSSSPAFGCLCYPAVLYRVIEAASRVDTDVLGLLKKCAADHGMRADWAMRQGTACPALPLNTTAATMVMHMDGNEPIFSKGRPTWAWGNLLQTGELMQRPDLLVPLADGPALGRTAVNYVMLVFCCCIVPAFVFVHHAVLTPLSAAYRRLDPGQRIVTCQHGVYALLFGLTIVPQTVLTARCLFRVWDVGMVRNHEFTLLIAFLVVIRAALYLIEASVRTVVRFSWLLVVHHSLYFVVLTLGVWTLNPPALIMGLVLDLFACYELPLYVALLAYRLAWPQRLTQGLMYGSMAWYVLTRVMQTVLLGYMIVGWALDPAVRTTPAFITTCVLVGAFTVIQAYTVVIYEGMRRRLARRARAGAGVPASPGDGRGAAGKLAEGGKSVDEPCGSGSGSGSGSSSEGSGSEGEV